MLKEAYYMAGRNIMSENDYEAKMISGNPRIQAALGSSKRDLKNELNRAGLQRNRISKGEFANRVADEFANRVAEKPEHGTARFAHFDRRMAKRVGKANYNNLAKQAYEEIVDFDKEASFAPVKRGPNPNHVKMDGVSALPKLPRDRYMGDGADEDKRKVSLPISRSIVKKAVAYYDEAQLVKEAAEADFAEACAYEEAAIAILDELGYLD